MRRSRRVVVVDPLSSFTGATFGEVNSMVMRLIDFLKGRNITALFTHLIPGSGASQDIEVGVSSLIDTWILLRNSPPGEHGGRHLSILKSRGMPHSSERRSFELTDAARSSAAAARTFRTSSAGCGMTKKKTKTSPSGRMDPAALRGRAERPFGGGAAESRGDLRTAPGRTLPD